MQGVRYVEGRSQSPTGARHASELLHSLAREGGGARRCLDHLSPKRLFLQARQQKPRLDAFQNSGAPKCQHPLFPGQDVGRCQRGSLAVPLGGAELAKQGVRGRLGRHDDELSGVVSHKKSRR